MVTLKFLGVRWCCAEAANALRGKTAEAIARAKIEIPRVIVICLVAAGA